MFKRRNDVKQCCVCRVGCALAFLALCKVGLCVGVVKPGKARQLNYFGQIAVDDASCNHRYAFLFQNEPFQPSKTQF